MPQFRSWFLGLGAMCLLIGCQQSATDRKAEQVRSTSQREADEVRRRTQAAGSEVRERADDAEAEVGRMNERFENQADAIEERGERLADSIEAQGEQKADALEAAEDEYWRNNYSTRNYVRQDAPYEDYRAAYLFGWQARQRYPGRTFDQVIADLEREWDAADLDSTMSWEEAQHPARDAWDRVR